MRKESMVIEEKTNKKWNTYGSVIYNKETIYKSLMHDLIAKKLHKCTYITSIKDICNYDGTRTITVSYDNDVRRKYTVEF